MAKQPKALRDYWAARRAAHSGRKTGGRKMARRYGKKGRAGKAKIPVLPVVALAAMGGEAMLAGNSHYGGQAPLAMMASGQWKEGAGALAGNFATPAPYMAMAIPLTLDVILRLLHVNPSLGKKFKLA